MPPNQSPLCSFEQRGQALGRDSANVTPLEENPALDTEAATRAKVEKTPYPLRPANRAALKLWIPPLTAHLAKTPPPRGFEQVLRRLTHEQFAFLALRSIFDQIHFGWNRRKDRRKKD